MNFQNLKDVTNNVLYKNYLYRKLGVRGTKRSTEDDHMIQTDNSERSSSLKYEWLVKWMCVFKIVHISLNRKKRVSKRTNQKKKKNVSPVGQRHAILYTNPRSQEMPENLPIQNTDHSKFCLCSQCHSKQVHASEVEQQISHAQNKSASQFTRFIQCLFVAPLSTITCRFRYKSG